MMRNILFFDSMLTPKFITFVYWLMLVGLILWGLGSIFSDGFDYITFGRFVKGIGIIVGGSIAVRIYCELMIVLFKINENVQRIANSKGGM